MWYHLVLVVKYRRQVIDDNVSQRLREVFEMISSSYNITLQEWNKVANQRKDFLHKLSNQITNVYDVVCVEDLNMRDMARALNFGKSVGDNGWYSTRIEG